MDTMLQSMNIKIEDDIIIYGSTQQDHDKNSPHYWKEQHPMGLCNISKKCISLFGQINDEYGIHLDPEQLEALLQDTFP